MKKTLPGDVYERFKQALVDGGATSDEDQEAISKALRSRKRGATDYARTSPCAAAGSARRVEMRRLRDLDWSGRNKPFKALLGSRPPSATAFIVARLVVEDAP